MFRATYKNFALGSTAFVEGSANKLRSEVPVGWHPVMEAFFAERDATEMIINSTSIGCQITFRRDPGAVAEPPLTP